MKRKDGKPKLKAKRNQPTVTFGFRDNPECANYRHPVLRDPHWKGKRTVTSLFSGCGGLDLGLLGGFTYLESALPSLNLQIVDAVDNLSDAANCYNLNLQPHCRIEDLTKLPVSHISKADILAGGFPCQDFSSSGPKTGFAGQRGQLYKVLVEYMQFYQPRAVIAENVPHLARLNEGTYLRTILREFEAQGYHFDVWDLYAPDYGLSQSRRRLFLVGVRNDLPGFPVPPSPSHKNCHLPIAHALQDLESVDDERVPNQSQFFVATKATSGGGQGDHTNEADRVAYCIRANSRGRIQFHYNLDRRLTVRECARLQSFPDQFIFPYTTQRNLTLIGNAVPPILGHHVAQSVENFLDAVEYSRAIGTKSATSCPDLYIKESRQHPIQQDFMSNLIP